MLDHLSTVLELKPVQKYLVFLIINMVRIIMRMRRMKCSKVNQIVNLVQGRGVNAKSLSLKLDPENLDDDDEDFHQTLLLVNPL